MTAASARAVRVVVVDNDPDALELLATDLGLEGMTVVGRGGDGDDAVTLCREQRPDVLVVDQRMPPGPNGLDVARRVRAEHPGVRVVLWTNHGDARLARHARAAGAQLVPKGDLRALRRAVATPTALAPE